MPCPVVSETVIGIVMLEAGAAMAFGRETLTTPPRTSSVRLCTPVGENCGAGRSARASVKGEANASTEQAAGAGMDDVQMPPAKAGDAPRASRNKKSKNPIFRSGRSSWALPALIIGYLGVL